MNEQVIVVPCNDCLEASDNDAALTCVLLAVALSLIVVYMWLRRKR